MPRTRPAPVPAVVLVLALVLAGCAARGAEQPAAPGSTSAAPRATTSGSSAGDLSQLRGITWLMTAATVDGTTMAVPGASEGNGGLTLTVGDGLGGYDGCNWFALPIPGDRATTDAQWSTTVACVAGEDLARAYHHVLIVPFQWRLGGDVLRIGDDRATHFDFVPFPEGFPSDVAGEDDPAIAAGTDAGLPYRIHLSRDTSGQMLCVSMEFRNELGENRQPVSACRSTDTARDGVVNPTDFYSSTVNGRGLLLGAVPSGTASRIVVQQHSGESTKLTLTPMPGTDHLVFYGFVPGPQRGDKVLFYDTRDRAIDPAWVPYW